MMFFFKKNKIIYIIYIIYKIYILYNFIILQKNRNFLLQRLHTYFKKNQVLLLLEAFLNC